MKSLHTLATALTLLTASMTANAGTPIYQDESRPLDERV